MREGSRRQEQRARHERTKYNVGEDAAKKHESALNYHRNEFCAESNSSVVQWASALHFVYHPMNERTGFQIANLGRERGNSTRLPSTTTNRSHQESYFIHEHRSDSPRWIECFPCARYFPSLTGRVLPDAELPSNLDNARSFSP